MLGDYELLGRLGEGGMGTVYLARPRNGTALVAVKVVRLDLADDDEFRRRFRSEVERARQVPPFCTAEVLDADPEHDQPYLVVEFVDGPTLAEVVEQRGPLTSANLHSVAIGVATALTAIHGAGVIHRDLKPRNVLLAPGSPKVIDFGIARAMTATSGNTRPDQMVGTVAYMAPERFDTDAGTPITPAADVFAWGSVVTYAGTGKTPFYADSPAATAARILTQPPRLHELARPLRGLVAHALEKDPANRPSARELLDLLISGDRPAATAAALADQPDLRAAAAEAQAVTGFAIPAKAMAGATTTAPTLNIPPGLVGYDENSIVTVPISSPPADTVITGDPPPAPRRRWLLPLVLVLLTAVLVAGAAIVAVMVRDRADRSGQPSGDPGGTVADPVLGEPRISDALTGPGFWSASDQPGEGRCDFADAMLVARRETNGLYKCRGPADELPANLTIETTLRLDTPDSCAAIWFRFDDSHGYQARICERNVYIGVHNRDGKGDVSTIRTFVLKEPLDRGTAYRFRLGVTADTVTVSRDGTDLGSARLTEAGYGAGRMFLGVFNERTAPKTGPFQVSYSDVRIWA
ncbi:putative Ser/Thr protein kinase [Actinoplanes octamycinicus]|uniref:Putative Ser/Thr protein kinase n=1 Tax=Actinoplanes octamycinicus TaxID=135948 RepID=A0A7W7H674_9ACTN|nr:serine/threonine-protein kinase [Actinoplanes octamycinicus]MBB4744584.1 putative Ser/Thr protein kinase [Actinoplanes octamycinicus]